jgi:hypothetical protein
MHHRRLWICVFLFTLTLTRKAIEPYAEFDREAAQPA